MSSHGSILAAAGLAAIVILASSEADADESSTVILVAPADDAFAARMRAELESMGFEVRAYGELAGEPPTGTLAVARIAPGPPRRIEVVVVATDASRRVPSRTAIIDAPAGEDEGVGSVRAAEQLRAFFQPLRPPPPPEEVDPAVPPSPPASPPSSEPGPSAPPSAPPPAAPREPPPAARDTTSPTAALSIGLGPGLDVGGVGLDAALAGRIWLHPKVVVGALVTFPLAPTTVEDREGSASLRVFVTGLDVGLSLPVAEDALRIHPSIGFGIAALITEGEATPPYASKSDVGSAALPFARLELSPRLVGPLRASLQGALGVAATDLGVRFDGREVATWGRPWGVVLLGPSLDL